MNYPSRYLDTSLRPISMKPNPTFQDIVQQIKDLHAFINKRFDEFHAPFKDPIDWDRVDNETRASEDQEVVEEKLPEGHTDTCSGCALCEI